jgi:hypothetical protein
MTAPSQNNSESPHWAVLGPEVPTNLANLRVLDVDSGEAPDQASAALGERGAEETVRRGPLGLERDLGGGFDLVLCRDSLQCDPHPMNLLTHIWHLTKAGGILLVESRILTAPEQSRYGRFVAADGESSSHWVPGRLAFRWMVEVSGYDVDRWLLQQAETTDEEGWASAYLHATRTERNPALDLATPARSQ